MTIHASALSPVKTVSALVTPCVVHRKHSPQQLVTQLHHVFPIYLQQRVWPNVDRQHPKVGELIAICGTGHDTVHAFIDLILAASTIPNGRWKETALARKAIAMYEAALANPNVPTAESMPISIDGHDPDERYK